MCVRTWIANTLMVAAVAATGCGGRLAYNLPPAQQLMHPGPGVGGPGPGVIPVGTGMTQSMPTPAAFGPGGMNGGGGGGYDQSYPAEGYPVDGGYAEQCQYCEGGACSIGGGCAGGAAAAGSTTQIAFVGEEGLQVSWDVSCQGQFDSAPLFVPGRQDFPQGAIYRLKLSNIPGRPGVTLYPTLEVAPVTPRTDAYLAHAPVPIQFTEEDLDQVMSGNFVTKVVYLPDPEFQELALSGVETLVSTRLDPGVDPVAEADYRGSILAILRIGSKDLENRGAYSHGVVPAGYGEDCDCDPNGGGSSDGGYAGESYGGGSYGDGGYSQANMPQGVPTAGFAPPNVPPHMIAGMNPNYGMPYVGTPIGLPGPPHIPLGSPAGLRKHVMKNRTRINLPPPTHQVKVSVKQRPGLNYPRPVNKVKIDEVHRAPLGGLLYDAHNNPGADPYANGGGGYGYAGDCN